MPKNLKRYYGRGDLHFVTFSCYRRIPLPRTSGARNVFVKALGAIRDRYKFSLVGYVVMPEHVHLLLSEPPKSTPSIVEPKSKTPRANRSCEKTGLDKR
jgi:putative transposase